MKALIALLLFLSPLASLADGGLRPLPHEEGEQYMRYEEFVGALPKAKQRAELIARCNAVIDRIYYPGRPWHVSNDKDSRATPNYTTLTAYYKFPAKVDRYDNATDCICGAEYNEANEAPIVIFHARCSHDDSQIQSWRNESRTGYPSS